MRISLISVPYDLDVRGEKMGRAPAALFEGGLLSALEAAGVLVVTHTEINANLRDGERMRRLSALGAAVAEAVRGAVAANSLPVILGGDCLNAVYACAGLGGEDMGIAWFDAHGDFNTPETTVSGYLGGMPLAAVCGFGLGDLCAGVGLNNTIAPDHVAMFGVRDLDAAEKELLDSTPISYLHPAEVNAQSVAAAAVYHFKDVSRVYLHFDIDCIDPSLAPGVTFPTPGGLSEGQALEAVGVIRAEKPLAALTLSALNPENDQAGKTAALAVRLLVAFLGED